jgi:glycosyltransferase involved in cell wall biosynthesis
MKILMLFPYAPLPPPLDLGGTKRNLPFFRELAKRNEVTVLSYGTPDEERIFNESFGSLCKEILFVNKKRPRILNAVEAFWLLGTGRSTFRQMYRPAMQQAIDAVTQKEHFDVIHCCTQMFGFFRFPSDTALVTDTHEVTYDLIFRTYQNTKNKFWKLFNYANYKLGKPDEIRACRTFSTLISTTDRDAAIFREILPGVTVQTIQNGVDSSFFEDLNIKKEEHSLVFTGLMSYFPNNTGMLYFLAKIFPIIASAVPDTKLYIVGKNPTKELIARQSDNVIVTGFVDDVRPFIARSSIYIIPLLVGGGIRGKALEAMAMRKAIVTTSIGVEGINLRHNYSALFADTPETFADAILSIFKDPSLREMLEKNGRATVEQENNWSAKGEALHQALQSAARSFGKQ